MNDTAQIALKGRYQEELVRHFSPFGLNLEALFDGSEDTGKEVMGSLPIGTVLQQRPGQGEK